MNKKETVNAKTMALTAHPIPYNKAYRKIAGSVTATILWQQLEYWFDTMHGKFFKFMEPVKDEKFGYQKGDSWTEELGFSSTEFRTAFGKIGTSYPSKKAFDTSDDKFKGKMYCSYYDKIARKTWYLRDQKKVESNLDELMSIISGDHVTESPEIEEADPEIDTEITAKTTQEIQELLEEPIKTVSSKSTLSPLIKFPNLTVSEKETKLKTEFSTIKHNEMIGLLGDLLIQNKPNAKEFLKATGGMKLIYPQIGLMLKKFPLDFLVDFFVGPKIPFRSDIPWKNYWWGACNKEYAYWSADREVARSKAREQEVPLIDFTDLIAEKSEGRWR